MKSYHSAEKLSIPSRSTFLCLCLTGTLTFIQGKETMAIVLHSDMHLLISFKLGMLDDITKLYSLMIQV